MKRAAVCAPVILALFAAAASIAPADEYAPSQLTAAQVLQKADAASGDLQPGKYVEVEEDHGGGVDTAVTTHIDGGDYVEYDKTGPFTSASGSYHGQHWRQNENGIVVLLSRFHAKVDPNVLAWENPDDPAYRVRVLGITAAQPHEYVLEANPPGGSDQYRYYDAKTFLLDRVVTYAKDRYRHVAEFSDYRTVFGETRWFKRTYSDGRPQNDEVDRVLSFTSEGTAGVPLTIPASRPLFHVGDKPVSLPVRFTRGGVIVRVTIAGRGLDLLIDSGASDVLLDPGVAHDLGIKPYGRTTQTIGGDFDMSRAIVPQMSVGPLQAQNVAVTLGPIDQHIEDARVVGLLGFDFLASAVPCFDFKAQSLTLYSRPAFDAQSTGFAAMPMMVDDSVPRVPASFERTNGWFLLDTGSFATMLYQSYLRKLPSAVMADTGFAGFSAVGGNVQARRYNVTDFSFGPLLFRDAMVTVPQISTFDMVDYDGIIGRDALSDYAFCLDYANRQAFLKSEAQ